MLACAPAEDCGLRHTGKLSPSWLEQQSFGVGDLAWPLFLTHTDTQTQAYTHLQMLVDSWLQEEDFKWRSRKSCWLKEPCELSSMHTHTHTPPSLRCSWEYSSLVLFLCKVSRKAKFARKGLPSCQCLFLLMSPVCFLLSDQTHVHSCDDDNRGTVEINTSSNGFIKTSDLSWWLSNSCTYP